MRLLPQVRRGGDWTTPRAVMYEKCEALHSPHLREANLDRSTPAAPYRNEVITRRHFFSRGNEAERNGMSGQMPILCTRA